jgi:quercetin dioxygenase-like cupin family protein
MTTTHQTGIVQPGAGRPIAGMGARAIVPSRAFEGRLFIFEGTLEPGAFIPPHTHTNEDEVTALVSGELTIDLGGQVSTATAGAFLIKPRDVHHSMWNHTDRPAQVLEIHTPGGLEPYYDALGELFAVPDLGDSEREAAIAELHAQYGIVYHADLIPEVVTTDGRQPSRARHGRS